MPGSWVTYCHITGTKSCKLLKLVYNNLGIRNFPNFWILQRGSSPTGVATGAEGKLPPVSPPPQRTVGLDLTSQFQPRLPTSKHDGQMPNTSLPRVGFIPYPGLALLLANEKPSLMLFLSLNAVLPSHCCLPSLMHNEETVCTQIFAAQMQNLL